MKSASRRTGGAGTDRGADAAELRRRLNRSDRRLTGARQAIMEVLRAGGGPMSIREVIAGLGEPGCDTATVYRAMHLLEGVGMVKRFDFGEGSARFEWMEQGDDGHHHHLICTSCSSVQEVLDCSVDALEQRLAERSGFTALSHRLEFFGICPSCQGERRDGSK